MGYDLLRAAGGAERQLAYILTLGVVKSFQGRGIASRLLDKVLECPKP